MGFDAGKITAHMDLSTDEFNDKADDVEQKKDDLAKGVETSVDLDADEFDAEAEKVEEKKDELKKPVTFEIDADGAPAIEEAKATDEAVRAELSNPTITPELDGAPAILEAEATGTAARAALSDAFQGAGAKGPLLQGLFEGGANTPQILAESLSNLGWSGADAKALVASINQDIFGALPPGSGAASLVKAILPSEAEFGRAMSDGIYSLMTGEATRIAAMYQIAGGEKGQFSTFASLARTAFGEQAQIGPGGAGGVIDVIARDADGNPFTGTDSGFWNDRTAPGFTTSASFGSGGGGASEAEQFAAQWRELGKKSVQDAQYAIFKGLEDGSIGSSNPWATLFSGKSGIADDISKAAKKMGVDVGKDFTDAMSKGVIDAAKESAGGSGFFGGLANSAVSGAGSAWSSLTGIDTGLSTAIVAAPLIVPILSAVGLAAGGAAAGTGIGTLGLLAGLLPGGLDLYHGYEAYSDQKSGTATTGLSSGNVAVGSAIGNLLHGGNGFLGGLEAEVNPDILKFIDSLTTALPTFEPFFTAATSSLSRFFGAVDAGLDSGGFKSFMEIMGKDVGPIMDDFGRFTSNAVGALGGFFKLFGGSAAQAVGGWFDRVSGSLDHWLNNARITPGEINAMTTAFDFLGAAGDLVWHGLEKAWDVLGPIGLGMMKFLTPALQGLTGILDDLPVNVLTGLYVALGIVALTADPLLQVAAAILAIGWAFKELKGIEAGNYKPLTGADISNAFAGELGGKTPADLSALAHARSLGLTPQQIGSAYIATAPRFTGSGLSSPSDSVNFSASGVATQKPSAGLKAAQDPSFGVFSAANVALAIKEIKDGSKTVIDALSEAGNGVTDWITKSLPNAASRAWHGVSTTILSPLADGVRTGWHDASHEFDNVTAGVSHWVTVSVPHAFERLPDLVSTAFDGFTSGVDIGRHNIAAGFNRVTTDIANFVTQSVPHAFSGLNRAVTGAFDGAESWLEGVGSKIINGLINGINTAINFANNHDPSIFGIHLFPTIPDIPHFADGGWVGGPPGAPQLAVVHGGEFVQSQAMLARGGMGGGPTVTISVDARGATSPQAVEQAAKRGVTATLPQLTRAFKGSRAA